MTTKLKPPHPGALLRETIEELGLTPYRVAKDIGVPVPKLNDIVLEKRGISADMALRLSVYFGTSDAFWSNLQTGYERRIARAKIEKQLQAITPAKLPDEEAAA